MKRKLIFTFGILLFFAFVTVNCSAQSSTNDQRIIGTWVCSLDGFTATYVFNANGSGTYLATSGTEKREGAFTYGVSIDGEIRIVGEYRNYGKIYFSPDARTMIFEGLAYRKK